MSMQAAACSGQGLTREQRKAQKKKARRHQQAMAAGKPIRSYQPTGLAVETTAQWRREYKRLQRMQRAQREGRTYAPRLKRQALHDAHVLAFKVAASAPLFDAHVVAYALHTKAVKARDESRVRQYQRYQTNPEAARAKARARNQRLVRSRLVMYLEAMGIPKSEVTDEMINLKREQVKLRRLSRGLKRAAANSLKEAK